MANNKQAFLTKTANQRLGYLVLSAWISAFVFSYLTVIIPNGFALLTGIISFAVAMAAAIGTGIFCINWILEGFDENRD